MTTHFEAEKAWSKISPLPIIKYLKEYDTKLVCWDTLMLTHKLAFALAMEHYGIWMTPEMKRHILAEYRVLNAAGIFGHNDWDGIIQQDFIPYLRKKITEHRAETLKNVTIEECLLLFIPGDKET